jgi:hypothetical protein
MSTSRSGHVLTLVCTGCAETESLRQLSDVLETLHGDAVRDSAESVVADVRALEFASSSCLKAFVTWLQRVVELEDARRYRVLFRSNPRHSWQRRSLAALAAFGGDVVAIEAEPS